MMRSLGHKVVVHHDRLHRTLHHTEVQCHTMTCHNNMTTSSNGNIFCVTGHLGEENSPHKGQWHWALMFSLICVWINGWVNNREAGDLRCYRAHYDVIVMKTFIIHNCFWHNWHTAGVIQINCMPNNCMHFITKKNMEIKLHTWNIFKIWVVFFPNVKKKPFLLYIYMQILWPVCNFNALYKNQLFKWYHISA